MEAKLGDSVRDMITEFEGIMVCRVEWLNGCIRIGIQSANLKDSKPLDVEYFDEAQIEVLEKLVLKPHYQASAEKLIKPPAGPTPIPQRHKDPTR